MTHAEGDATEPRKRILIVDDEVTLRALVAETLRGEGYLVEEAGNGAEALDYLRADPPDLILLDLAMPILDGHGMIEQWRADPAFEAVPIVVVSSTPSLPEGIHEAGIKALLVKPFDLGVLLAMVERYATAASTRNDSAG